MMAAPFSLSRAPVTRALLAANIGVFALAALSVGTDVANLLGGLIPARLTGQAALPGAVPPLLTLGTSAFLHAGVLHLALNMAFLAWLGRALEPALGSERFAGLYGLALVTAALAQILSAPASPHPVIGASGAVAGVFGAHALLHALHQRHVRRLPPRPWTEAGRLMLLWTLFQLGAGLAFQMGGVGLAVWAHVGGFAAGLGWVLARLRPLPQASG